MAEIVSLVPWPDVPPLLEPQPADEYWWDRYWYNLQASPLSQRACAVVDADSSYIVDHGLFGAGRPHEGLWPVSRVRKGLVMGSVQSGKTASMLAVAAKSLDSGVDAVVILAGTQVGLWRQTYRRVVDQLDLSGPQADTQRIVLPSHEHGRTGDMVSPSALYGLAPARARRAVSKGRPVLAVALKNVHHLKALGQALSGALVPEAERQDQDFHVLILDDEADDGSIDEAGLEGSDVDFRQLPNTIVDLWDDRPRSGATKSPKLYVTYMAYTATPQANFLQHSQNSLAPTDFVISLRTPLDHGQLTPRSPTFEEPDGPSSYYVGGEIFYRRLGHPGLTVALPDHQAEALPDAIRAFLVAGAVRLWRQAAPSLLPQEARAGAWPTADEARTASPKPHSMLYHPSAQISDHFEAAAMVLAWASSISLDEALGRIRSGERSLPTESLIAHLESDEEPWRRWVDEYRASHERLTEVFTSMESRRPAPDHWAEIKKLLVDEVIPTTNLAIVNSDPDADDRPQFDPVRSDGSWLAPPNLSTIFVAGNVMSRGLTLEGLTTTLFLRSSDDPYADTQSQMQRWFGYRGSYMDLVRLFADSRQIDLFGAYHDADEAVRSQVIGHMDVDGPAPLPTVLQGHEFKATGKIADIRSVPLWPGGTPFIRLINDGVQPDQNTRLVADTFAELSSHDVVVAGATRGRILDDSVSLSEAAALLDQLAFDGYDPSPEGWQAARWRSAEDHLKASEGKLSGSLYRTPAPVGTAVRLDQERVDCPYAVAAYLRLWAECLKVRSKYFVSTDDAGTPWSMIDLEEKREQQPRFYVGIRYGSEPSEPLVGTSFTVRPMARSTESGELIASWGSRNRASDWAGDEWFDVYAAGGSPTAAELDSGVRHAGAPGLILFHPVRQPGSAHLTTAAALSIPSGGPDQIAARPRR